MNGPRPIDELGDGTYLMAVDELRSVSTDPIQQARIDAMNVTDHELGDLEAQIMIRDEEAVVVVVHWPTIKSKLGEPDNE